MKKVKLNVSFEIDSDVYNKWLEILNDVSGCKSKEELEEFIVSGIEGDLEFNEGKGIKNVVFD